MPLVEVDPNAPTIKLGPPLPDTQQQRDLFRFPSLEAALGPSATKYSANKTTKPAKPAKTTKTTKTTKTGKQTTKTSKQTPKTSKQHPRVQRAMRAAANPPRIPGSRVRTSDAPAVYGECDYHVDMDARASEILGVSVTSKVAVPACGEDSPFLMSLTAAVPKDIYDAANVYSVDADGVYEFKPWFFVFATTPALNTYVELYERTHGAGSFQPAKAAFMEARRTIKNREYQRFHRRH